MIVQPLRQVQRLLQPRTIRGRAVASAVAPLLLGSLVIAGVSVGVLGLSLPRSLDAALSARVADVVAQLEEPGATASDPPTLGPVDPADPILIEVRTPNDHLLTTSAGLPANSRLCPAPLPRSSTHDSPDLAIGGREVSLRRQVTVVTTGPVPAVVCAARRDDATRVLRTALFAILVLLVPAGVVLVCLLLYRTVTKALEPVEGLTHEAERLSDLTAGRLPLPGTADEIEDLAVTLNRMLDRLHEQAQAGRRFVADAGHELRSPLSTLRVALELVAEAPASEAGPTLAVAFADLERLEQLVQDLLVLATAQLHHADPSAPSRSAHAVDLRTLADQETRILARRRQDLAVTVSSGVEVQEAPLVRGDERALTRIVRNLLDNAARHAQHYVEIKLQTAANDEPQPRAKPFVTLNVRDDGPGFPVEEVHRVFQPFVRLDDARRRDDGGSGLGLSIVAATVQQLGGTVRAHRARADTSRSACRWHVATVVTWCPKGQLDDDHVTAEATVGSRVHAGPTRGWRH